MTERSTAVRLPLGEGETAPSEPITLAEIREELRITLTDEDHRLETLARSARQWLEEFYQLALIPGTHRCTVPASARGRLDLPVTPVRAVLTVSRRDADGELELLTASDWWADLDYRPARVWVRGCGIYVVTCTTGWATPAEVPPPLKEAITYRTWGYFDGVKPDDWKPIVRQAVQPYRARLL